MATVNGVNYAKQLDPSPANILAKGTLRGKLRCFQDTYECSTLATSSNTILMGQTLPTGSIVTNIIVGNDLLGFGTIAVGDQGTPAKYHTGISTNAARLTQLPQAITGMGYSVTGTTDNIIRITTTQDSVFNGTITVTVFYTEE